MVRECTKLKETAVEALKEYLDSLDEGHQSKLAYWICDYVNFLKKEKDFDPRRTIRYKRGSLIKVHLGYRIGREEGGLHYAIVIDANNSMNSDILTVIPLTSIKPKTKPCPYNVNIGNEIYDLVTKKLNHEISVAKEGLRRIEDDYSKSLLCGDEKCFDAEIKELNAQLNRCEMIKKEIGKMKTGSIALVNQITTVSKQRIYDPKNSGAVLFGIRVSNNTLDLIDNKVLELFFPK